MVLQGIAHDNVVQVTLVGACGSCPMATVTMKMGLERTLKQRIPSITAVEQVAAPVPVLSTEAVEVVLEGVRPIVSVAGGMHMFSCVFALYCCRYRRVHSMQPRNLLQCICNFLLFFIQYRHCECSEG